MKDWWCWPSNERNANDGPAFVKRIDETMARVRERLGKGPNVLLGFSNGGYFAALIAKRSLARFDAIAIAHGGPINVEPVRREMPPILLVTADDDVSDSEMMLLDDELTRDEVAARARRARRRARASRLGHRLVAHVLRSRAQRETPALAAAADAIRSPARPRCWRSRAVSR